MLLPEDLIAAKAQIAEALEKFKTMQAEREADLNRAYHQVNCKWEDQLEYQRRTVEDLTKKHADMVRAQERSMGIDDNKLGQLVRAGLHPKF